MGCGYHGTTLAAQDGAHAAQDGLDAVARWAAARGRRGHAPSSGNRAFDEYRTETLRRLEDEQREFREFLDRLRVAKDKTEFDRSWPSAATVRADDRSATQAR